MCQHTCSECKEPASHDKSNSAISTTQTSSFVLPILVSVQSPSSHAPEFVTLPLEFEDSKEASDELELHRWPSSSEVCIYIPL